MMEKNVIVPPLVAILAVIATFFLVLFVGSAFVLTFGYDVTMALSELLIIVIPLGYMLFTKVDVSNYIGLDVKPSKILLGIALGGLVLLFDMVITFSLVSILGPSETMEEANSTIMEISASPKGLLLVIIGLSLAGICEEFTFRGFLQNSINSKYPSWVGVIVSALAFGLFHFDPQALYIISAFLIGLVLGYIYHRWHSYVVSAVAHASVNLIALALMLLVR